MTEPENLKLTSEEFLAYLKNECRDYIQSQLLNDNENSDLDDNVYTEQIFFHVFYKRRILELVDTIKDKFDVTFELKNYDRNTECLFIVGRFIGIEKVKRLLQEGIRR